MDQFAAPSARNRTLVDILPQVPTGAEIMIRHLGISTKSARLAFRGLRDYIDQNASELRFTLRPAGGQPWAPHQGRWPSCTRLEVRKNGGDTDADGAATSAAAALATVSTVLGPASRQRITHLTFVGWEGAEVSESAILEFALLLPNLQELDLHVLRSMSFQPHAQQLLYEGVATLQHLRSLGLPSCRALPSVGVLAGNLTRLSVLGVSDFADNGNGDDADAHWLLDASGIAAIAQLRLLKELALKCWRHWAAAEQKLLPRLLDSLPPALERLSIATQYTGSLSATLEAGGIRELTLPQLERDYQIGSLARTLLSSRAVGPQLQSMVIESIDAHEWLQDPDLQPLWELAGRCGRIEAQSVRCHDTVWTPFAESLAAAEYAIRRLGPPGRLSLDKGTLCVTLKFPASASHPTAAGTPRAPGTVGAPLQVSAPHASSRRLGGGGCGDGSTSGGSSSGRQQYDPASSNAAGLNSSAAPPPPLPLPSAAEAVEAVLQRMVSGAPAGALVRLVPGAGAAEGPTAGAEERAAAAACRPRAYRGADGLVLLRGPFVALLVPAPAALRSWVDWLDERAAARLAAAGAGPGGADRFYGRHLGSLALRRADEGRRGIQGYQVLPPVLERPGVLLWCGGGDAVGVAAVAAAAREVGAAKGAAGALEVVQLPGGIETWQGGGRGSFGRALGQQPVKRTTARAHHAPGHLLSSSPAHARQEVEALWEHLLPRCGGDLEAELRLMRDVAGLLGELAEMPEEVRL